MPFFLPENAINQHIAILGKTGSGKTWTAKTIVEHALDKNRQVCVLDPTAAWFGLRLGADGKARGYDVVLLGGKHADIPLAERSGNAVARLVTEQNASVVIDTSGFTVGQYTRWFIDFAETLYTTIRHPLHLVIDEAHYFMPQGGGGRMEGDSGKMLHCGNRLMSGGRSLGIRGMMITQRPAKLHKDSLTCADTLIAMRVIAPQDRAAVKAWIDGAGDEKQGKEVLDSLAQLKRGEGWVWYPEASYLKRVTFPAIKTYDSSATPVHGAKAPTVSQIDLAEVRDALADAVKEAEANDPGLLRQQIAKLKAELAKRPTEKVVETKEVRVEVPVLKNGQLDKANRLIERLTSFSERFVKEVLTVNETALKLAASIDATLKASAPPRPAPSLPRPAPSLPRPTGAPPPAPIRRPAAASSDGASDGITPRQQRFLDAAATLTTLGTEVTRETVAAWVGVHPRGGSVGEELKALEVAGLITVDRGWIVVTDAGAQQAQQIDPMQAIESAKNGLQPRQRAFFEAIMAAYPEGLTREQVGEQFNLHPRGGSLGEDLGRLVGRGLVERDRGVYRARQFLFAAVG